MLPNADVQATKFNQNKLEDIGYHVKNWIFTNLCIFSAFARGWRGMQLTAEKEKLYLNRLLLYWREKAGQAGKGALPSPAWVN